MTQKSRPRIIHSLPIPIEKFDKDGDAGTFEGLGSAYGVPIKRFFGTVVMEPGLFRDSLAKKGTKGIRMLWNHNDDEPIGVWRDLQENQLGLEVKGKLLIDDIVRAKETHALMKNEAIGGLSVGFSVEELHTDKEGVDHYTKAELWEISPVTFPANSQATIDAVHSAMNFDTERDLEQFLREAGLPRKAAVAIALHGFKGLGQGRDAAGEGEIKDLITELRETIRGN